MTTESWPVLMGFSNNAIAEKLQEMDRIREDDISDFTNLSQVFMAGRKVQRIPSSSTDVLATDRAGDFNYSATYLYIAVMSGGVVVWRRIGLASW